MGIFTWKAQSRSFSSVWCVWGILAAKKNQLLVSNLNNKTSRHPKHPHFFRRSGGFFLRLGLNSDCIVAWRRWNDRVLDNSFDLFSIHIYWNLLDIFCIWNTSRQFRFGFSLWKKATMTCIDGDSAAILDRLVGSLQLSKVTKGKVRCEARVLTEKSLSCLQHQLHIGPGL